MDFTIRIGLEVHIQLKTATKLFSPEPYIFGQTPNHSIDPVTTGLPGVLPSVNQKAIDLAVIVALATNCKINRQITFDRKNYFYPDLPKGFQITQKTNPVGVQGEVAFINHKKEIQLLGIKQVHIEEDAAKSNYHKDKRYIDYTRAGVPLVEIVTTPGLYSPEDAAAFLDYLRILAKECGVSDGKMEEGAIRCDANVSVSLNNTHNQYNEIKNLNSVKELKTALQLEIKRQQNEFKSNAFKRGYTLRFNSSLNRNDFSRKKEKARDYAYIPEPDILPVNIDEETIQKQEAGMHELPAERYQRFLDSYGLPKEGAWVLSINKELSVFFEKLYPWIIDKHEFVHFLMGPFKLLNKKEATRFFLRQGQKDQLVSLINMITQGEISRETAYQNIWPALLNSENKTTFDIAKENDWLINNNDAELLEVIQKIISGFPEEKNAFQNGKSKIIGFFMGQIMKTTKNRFQPRKIKKLLLEELKK